MTYRNPYAPPPDYETISSNVMQADPLAQLAENVRRVRARSAELLQRSTATLQANADYRPDLPQSAPRATMVGQGLSQDIYNNAHPGAVGRSLPRQINSTPPPDGYADGGPVRAYDNSSMVGRVAKGAMGTLAPNALMAMLMEYQRQGN